MPMEASIVIACIIGYLLGSLSGGIITAKLANGPDLHTVGSKSTGASNVQRTMGWKYGIISFLIVLLVIGDLMLSLVGCDNILMKGKIHKKIKQLNY